MIRLARWVLGLLAAVGIWWAGSSRQKSKADAARLQKELDRTQHEAKTRKKVKDAIENSKSDGDGWHKRLRDAADRKRGDL